MSTKSPEDPGRGRRGDTMTGRAQPELGERGNGLSVWIGPVRIYLVSRLAAYVHRASYGQEATLTPVTTKGP